MFFPQRILRVSNSNESDSMVAYILNTKCLNYIPFVYFRPQKKGISCVYVCIYVYVCVYIFLKNQESSPLRSRNLNTICRSLDQYKGSSSRTGLSIRLTR